MESNLDKIALDLYGKIQTRFPSMEVGDENNEVLTRKSEMNRGRFFEFKYVEHGEPLGTITITLDNDDGVVVQLSGNLSEDKHPRLFDFLRGLRIFAKKRLLKYDEQNIGKDNLDKRDYHFQSKPKEQPAMPQAPIMENKMYGNARMSYQDLGEARLVIKHNAPVNLDIAAGRTMHIESIYIENAQGERFKYPFKHLNGARALAEHIKHGGNPYDGIGKHICSLSEELASLRKFKGFVGRQEQVSEAMGSVTGRVIDRIEQIKETIHKLQRTAYYESFVESFEEQEEQMIPEEVANDLINRLTVRTFNEELKSVFPYIYKFVDESQLDVLEVNPEDILGEGGVTLGGGGFTVDDQIALNQKMQAQAGSTPPGINRLTGKPIAPQTAAPAAAAPSGGASTFSHYSDEYLMKAVNAMRNGVRLRLLISGPDAEAELKRRGVAMPAQAPEAQFESFMDSIVNEVEVDMSKGLGLFDKNETVKKEAINNLNKIFKSELKGGPGSNINIVDTLSAYLPAQDPTTGEPLFPLETLKKADPSLDVRVLIQMELENIAETNDDIARVLNSGLIDFSGGEGEVGGEDTPPAPAPAPAPAEPAPAPEAPAAEVPPAPAPEAPAAEVPPAPLPVAEGEEPPFDKPYKKVSGDVTDKSGAKHGGRSQAKHLAHQGIKSAIEKARKAGATLDTEMDFGHKAMTLHDALKECGMRPEDVGFEPQESGLDQMLKFVSGFYNSDTVNEGNFPLGGTRIKIKVKKAFEDGMFSGATPDDLMKVLKFIDMKDPSGDHHQQRDILRLAGVKQHEHEVDEQMPDFSNMMKGMAGGDVDAMFNQMKSMPGATVTNTSSSSGTVNGKPASEQQKLDQLNQLMSQFKMSFGGKDINLNNPEEMGSQLRDIVGNQFKNIQSQVPNQSIQLPGGSGQINPQDFMKHIMQMIPNK